MLPTFKKYPVCVSLPKGLDAVSIVQPLINTKPGLNIMEIWKDIKGFPDYLISDKGRVLSKKRITIRSNGIKLSVKRKILKPCYDTKGYLRVYFFKNGKKETRKVHRLVLEAFIPNLKNKPQTNHKDGVKDNNKIENLEYATAKENVNHAVMNGLMRWNHGENVHNSILSNSEVLEIKKLLKKKTLFHREIGEIFGVARRVITKINTKETYSTIN